MPRRDPNRPLQATIFGTEIPAPVTPLQQAREPVVGGYAARPGTGPGGEFCGSCRYLRRQQIRSGRRYFKCGRVPSDKTDGQKGDIKRSALARAFWASPVLAPPPVGEVTDEETERYLNREMTPDEETNYEIRVTGKPRAPAKKKEGER